ncbi:MAG: Sjogren's syndrome/scleroderma autoantigen 1 family protein [Salinarchaeum sp.]
MSDFDKEAEREKLRKRFGEESQNNTTERMSELLLRGATMTNKHCDTCGNPLFRKDGQEFCPECDVTDERTDATAEEPADTQPPTPDEPASTTDSSSADDLTVTPTAEPTASAGSAETPSTSSEQSTDEPAGSLAAGREALVAALTEHAREGANTHDPHRAKAHLEAAREAAAALDELQ